MPDECLLSCLRFGDHLFSPLTSLSRARMRQGRCVGQFRYTAKLPHTISVTVSYYMRPRTNETLSVISPVPFLKFRSVRPSASFQHNWSRFCRSHAGRPAGRRKLDSRLGGSKLETSPRVALMQMGGVIESVYFMVRNRGQRAGIFSAIILRANLQRYA